MTGLLDVSAAAYEEIKERLRLCGAGERVTAARGSMEVLDLGEIGLRKELDQRLTVYLVFDGKLIKGAKDAAHNGSTEGQA